MPSLLFLAAVFFLVGTQSRLMTDTAFPGLSEVTWLPEHGKVSHSHDAFVGSPSLVRPLPGKDLILASHDYFFLTPGEPGVVSVFVSSDSGVNWSFTANVTSMYWANLWKTDGSTPDVFLMGTSSDEGTTSDLVIAKCAYPCDGTTWTPAAVLVKGTARAAFHAAPQPVAHVDGKYARAFEVHGTDVPVGNLAIVVAAAEDTCSDLASPSCWSLSTPMHWNSSWPQFPAPGSDSDRQWEEADLFVDDGGKSHVAVRLDGPLESCTSSATCMGAALLSHDVASNSLSFVDRIALPSGCNKFTIRQAPFSHNTAGDKKFYAFVNPVTVEGLSLHRCGQRNVLMVVRSDDLKTWETCSTPILFDDTGLATSPETSIMFTGFQYVYWDWVADDTTNPKRAEIAVRAGYRGSTTYHDANRLLYLNLDDIDAAAGCSH